MSEQNNLKKEYISYLKSFGAEELDELKLNIAETENTVRMELEKIVKEWIENQKLKRLCNALSNTVVPDQNKLQVDDDDFASLVSLINSVYQQPDDSKNTSVLQEDSLDLSDLTETKLAIYKVLYLHRRPLPLNQIISDLKKFKFDAKVKNPNQNVRSTLDFDSKKNYFKQNPEDEWYFTQEGKAFFDTKLEKIEADKNLLLANPKLTTKIVKGMKEEPSDDSHKTRTQSGRFLSPLTAGTTKRVIDLYADIIRESGNTEIDSNEIALVFNEKYNQSRTGSYVKKKLLENAHTKNPTVRYSNNKFSLISNDSEKLLEE